MRITVKLFANLRDRLPDTTRGVTSLDLPERSSLADLLDRLEIPERAAPMVLVNGDQQPRGRERRADVALAEGDTVAIFPPLAGG